MKTIINLFIITGIILLINSCSTPLTVFPISKITPAAQITAEKSVDEQQNFVLEIIARNLASADRLNPPGNNYSVWIVTSSYRVKNVGQLIIENAEKGSFKTSTPFDFHQVFITVEDQPDLHYPVGVEISRTRI